MHFTAAAELRLDILTATGRPGVEGRVLVFTPDDAVAALETLDQDWRDSLPDPAFWGREAPDATWYGAFAPTDQGRIPHPPPSEGERFELVCGGRAFPGVVLNDTLAPGQPHFERYFIAGTGDVPIEPEPSGRCDRRGPTDRA